MNLLTKLFERIFVRDSVGAPRSEVSKNLTVIETGKRSSPIILRFSNRGDVEYLHLSLDEARALQHILERTTKGVRT